MKFFSGKGDRELKNIRIEIQGIDGKIRSIQSAFETLRSQNDEIILNMQKLNKEMDRRLIAIENKVHP